MSDDRIEPIYIGYLAFLNIYTKSTASICIREGNKIPSTKRKERKNSVLAFEVPR